MRTVIFYSKKLIIYFYYKNIYSVKKEKRIIKVVGKIEKNKKVDFIEKKYNQTHLKSTFFKSINDKAVSLMISSRHSLNFNKIEKLSFLKKPLQLIKNKELKKEINKENIDIYIDKSIKDIVNFSISGDNEDEFIINNNWERDFKYKKEYDIRNVEEGDLSPDGNGKLNVQKGIEIGHIFQLKDKYSKKFQHNKIIYNNSKYNVMMGCYGIGISRLIAAYIEQNNDSKGIVWSDILSPFKIIIVPINYENDLVKKVSNEIYKNLKKKYIDVLLDDSKDNPGVKFNNMELIGIPHRIIVSEKNLKRNIIEYSSRRQNKKSYLELESIYEHMRKIL